MADTACGRATGEGSKADPERLYGTLNTDDAEVQRVCPRNRRAAGAASISFDDTKGSLAWWAGRWLRTA